MRASIPTRRRVAVVSSTRLRVRSFLRDQAAGRGLLVRGVELVERLLRPSRRRRPCAAAPAAAPTARPRCARAGRPRSGRTRRRRPARPPRTGRAAGSRSPPGRPCRRACRSARCRLRARPVSWSSRIVRATDSGSASGPPYLVLRRRRALGPPAARAAAPATLTALRLVCSPARAPVRRVGRGSRRPRPRPRRRATPAARGPRGSSRSQPPGPAQLRSRHHHPHPEREPRSGWRCATPGGSEVVDADGLGDLGGLVGDGGADAELLEDLLLELVGEVGVVLEEPREFSLPWPSWSPS